MQVDEGRLGGMSVEEYRETTGRGVSTVLIRVRSLFGGRRCACRSGDIKQLGTSLLTLHAGFPGWNPLDLRSRHTQIRVSTVVISHFEW